MSIYSLNLRIEECNSTIEEYRQYIELLDTASTKMFDLATVQLATHVENVRKAESSINFGVSAWEGNRVIKFKEAYNILIEKEESFSSLAEEANVAINDAKSEYETKITELKQEIINCKNQIADIQAAEAAAAAAAAASAAAASAAASASRRR